MKPIDKDRNRTYTSQSPKSVFVEVKMKNYQEEYKRYTAGEKKVNEMYHRIAMQLGISDSALWTLYCLSDDEDPHTQNSIAQKMAVPKQTINSAVTKLFQDGYVHLKPIPGAKNNKQILLTEKGSAFCMSKIVPVVKATERAFNRLSAQEREEYLTIGMKHNQFLLEELCMLIDIK